MVELPGWTMKPRSRIIAAVAAGVIAAGGIVLGLELSGSQSPAANHPATSSTGNSGLSASGTDAAVGSTGAGSSSSSTPSSTAPAPLKVAAICTVVRGNLSSTITVSACSQLQATGGSGTFAGTVLAGSGSATITWSGAGTTTFVYVSSHPASQRSKCPAADTETTLRGSVTANSPLGAGNAGIRGSIRAKLCIDPALNVSLLAGRAFQL